MRTIANMEKTKIIRGGYDDYFWICEQCKAQLSDYSIKPKSWKYCPYCGREIEK